MNKRVNSRFTLKTTENLIPEKFESSHCDRISGMMGVAHESGETKLGTGEVKSGRKEKPTKTTNMSKQIPSKRSNPYTTHSIHRNPKAKPKKQNNRKTEVMKTKPTQNKVEKKAKSTDKRIKTANTEEEKYEKDKRKSEITNKLQRFKSVKRVKLNEEAGDIKENMCEHQECNLDKPHPQRSPEFIECKSNDEIGGTENTSCSETSDETLQLQYWDNVLKMADEELKKSNDLVEIIRSMSVKSIDIDTDKILSELRAKASQKIDQSSEDLQAMNKNKDINMSELSSRSKYTLLEPLDFDKIPEKSTSENSDVYDTVQREEESQSDEGKEKETVSMHFLPQSLSETILNLNQSNSVTLQMNMTHYIHEQSSNEDFYLPNPDMVETNGVREYLVDKFNRSNVQLMCECDSSDEDDVNIGTSKSQSNVDISESDEVVRDWTCKNKRRGMIYNNEADDVEIQEQDVKDAEGHLTEMSQVEDCESDSSELDDDKLFPTTIVSGAFQGSLSDIGAYLKLLPSDHYVPRTCSNFNMEEYADFANRVQSNKSTSSIINFSGK